MAVVEVGNNIEYYMHPKLKIQLHSKVRDAVEKRDKDFVLGIDGAEGAGKSTFGVQIAKFTDPTFCLERICFTPQEFRDAIIKAEKGQCVIFDEAFTGLSSRSSLSEINRMLVSLMMQMRQKNLFVIIILPTFFLLDKYVAVWRLKALIHVYESKGRRGYFLVFNRAKKKLLYLRGSKTYNYRVVKTKFRGRFYGVFALGKEAEIEYRLRKENALMAVERTVKVEKFMLQRDKLLYLIHKELKISGIKMAKLFEQYDIPLKRSFIAEILAKYRGKEDKASITANIP